MLKKLDLIVAVHGLEPWNEIDLAKLRTMESTLRRMGKVSPDHKVKLPMLVVCPDEKIKFINGKNGLKNPYKDGKRGYTSIDEALARHEIIAPHEGDGKGVPLVLTPEFRRYQTRKSEYRRLDLTNMYHIGPNLTLIQKTYFREQKNQERVSSVYAKFSGIYKTILRALRVPSHPKCYNLALEAAAQESHFGETFIRGFRGMRVEAARPLEAGSSNQEIEYEDSYDPRQNIKILMNILEQRLKRTKPDKQIYSILVGCYRQLNRLYRDTDICHSPRILTN